MRGLLPTEVLVLQSALPCIGQDCAKLIAPPEVAHAAFTLLHRGALAIAPCYRVPGGNHVVPNELGRWLLGVHEQLDRGAP
jgi:hypothetical protein